MKKQKQDGRRNNGGSRPGSGAKKKEKTVVISKRVPFIWKTQIKKQIDRTVCAEIRILNKKKVIA